MDSPKKVPPSEPAKVTEGETIDNINKVTFQQGNSSIPTPFIKSSGGGMKLNLEKVRLKQNFPEMLGIKKEAGSVPIHKAGNQLWHSPCSNPKSQIPVPVIEIGETREIYVVTQKLLPELSSEWHSKLLVLCQTRQQDFFLWPIRLPSSDGTLDSWNTSAHEILRDYADKWIRIRANREMRAYEVLTPVSPLPAPEWPEDPTPILEKALRDRIIDSMDHHVLKELRGEL